MSASASKAAPPSKRLRLEIPSKAGDSPTTALQKANGTYSEGDDAVTEPGSPAKPQSKGASPIDRPLHGRAPRFSGIKVWDLDNLGWHSEPLLLANLRLQLVASRSSSQGSQIDILYNFADGRGAKTLTIQTPEMSVLFATFDQVWKNNKRGGGGNNSKLTNDDDSKQSAPKSSMGLGYNLQTLDEYSDLTEKHRAFAETPLPEDLPAAHIFMLQLKGIEDRIFELLWTHREKLLPGIIWKDKHYALTMAELRRAYHSATQPRLRSSRDDPLVKEKSTPILALKLCKSGYSFDTKCYMRITGDDGKPVSVPMPLTALQPRSKTIVMFEYSSLFINTSNLIYPRLKCNQITLTAMPSSRDVAAPCGDDE